MRTSGAWVRIAEALAGKGIERTVLRSLNYGAKIKSGGMVHDDPSRPNGFAVRAACRGDA